MLLSMCTAFWEPVRDSVLPLVVALQPIIVLWVASRLRSISGVVQSTSLATEATLTVAHTLLGRSASPPVAPDPRKSSTKETTSTSPGEALNDERPAP